MAEALTKKKKLQIEETKVATFWFELVFMSFDINFFHSF